MQERTPPNRPRLLGNFAGGHLLGLRGKCQADAVDTVFVNRENLVDDAVLVGDRLTLGGNVLQKLVDVARDGVVIVGGKGKSGGLADVLKLRGTVDQKLGVGDALDGVLLILVVLIADLADNLLQEVLLGDDAGRRAVLIQNDRDGNGLPAQLGQKVRSLFELVGEERLAHQFADVKVLLAAVVVEEVL